MKFLTLFLIAVLALAAFAVLVHAQQTPITAYSVTNIAATGVTDLGVTSYTATASTTRNPKTAAVGFPNGTLLTIFTTDCTFVPKTGEGGESGIIVTNGAASTILFSSGAVCAVKSVAINTKAL